MNAVNLNNFKVTVIPFPLIIFVAIISIIVGLITLAHNTTSVNRERLTQSIRLAEEWAYFQGQKEAISGDVRIKYNESTHKYSWTKSCWDGGTKPIFDPAESEDMSYYFNKLR